MDIKSINTKTATVTVEIEIGAARALEMYLEQQIGYCRINGFNALADKYTREHESIRDALDKIHEYLEAERKAEKQAKRQAKKEAYEREVAPKRQFIR